MASWGETIERAADRTLLPERTDALLKIVLGAWLILGCVLAALYT